MKSETLWWNEQRRAVRAAATGGYAPGWLAAVAVACLWFTLAPARVVALGHAADTGGVSAASDMIEHTIRPGDCFAAILAAHGVATEEVGRWHRAARSQTDLGHLEPGHALRLQFDPSGRLRAVRYDVDRERILVVERGAGDRLVARSVALPVAVRPVGMRITVRRSVRDAARQAGLPDAIISQMVDLLSWKLTFKSDIHRGDRLRVLYEQRSGLDGRPLKPGRILAVDYAGRSQSTAAYLSDTQDGEPVYVDDKGHPVNGAPLRYPLEFTRMTSAFSQSRFDPILQRSRPHLGVDFAAPAGTPVHAVGAGTVQWAGARGGFGNHVELNHGGGLVSTYSHLQGIERAIKPGVHVARGQLLGWVGQTGWATGPHLHFAFFDHGRYVNPLTIAQAPQLAAVDPRVFARLRTEMLARLQALPQGPPSAPSAPEIGPSPLAQAGRVGPINLTF